MLHFYKYRPSRIIIVVMLLVLPVLANAQLSISGLTCVTSGGSNGYLYTISGDLETVNNVSWSVAGGTIVQNDSSSLSGAINEIGSQIRVVWNEGAGRGQITLTSDSVATLDINVIDILNEVSPDSLAAAPGSQVTISGSGPSSVSCVPLFNYWWESAPASAGPFTPTGAVTQNLVIDSSPGTATYYRRALSVNGEINYSNVVKIIPGQ